MVVLMWRRRRGTDAGRGCLLHGLGWSGFGQMVQQCYVAACRAMAAFVLCCRFLRTKHPWRTHLALQVRLALASSQRACELSGGCAMVLSDEGKRKYQRPALASCARHNRTTAPLGPAGRPHGADGTRPCGGGAIVQGSRSCRYSAMSSSARERDLLCSAGLSKLRDGATARTSLLLAHSTTARLTHSIASPNLTQYIRNRENSRAAAAQRAR